MNCLFIRSVNVFLFILTRGSIIFGVLLLVLPQWPMFQRVRIESKLTDSQSSENEIPIAMAGERKLYIPAIDVVADVYSAKDIGILETKEGVWHDSSTATPFSGSNTVIAGHRFQYLPPNTTTFYNLDLLLPGMEIFIDWDQIRYNYIIDSIFEVDPNETWINDASSDSKLTIYTCTPLYTSTKRLVVVANIVT